jgi:ribonucleoside-triphosphate reductase
LPTFKKLQLEGIFHNYCNGGCITYAELGEAPLSNDEGLMEYIEEAIKSGVHYLGFNFPKDVCNECGTSGVFDVCPHCNSTSITRIRRVSGYLEILDGFTKGKKNEEKTRRAN